MEKEGEKVNFKNHHDLKTKCFYPLVIKLESLYINENNLMRRKKQLEKEYKTHIGLNEYKVKILKLVIEVIEMIEVNNIKIETLTHKLILKIDYYFKFMTGGKIYSMIRKEYSAPYEIKLMVFNQLKITVNDKIKLDPYTKWITNIKISIYDEKMLLNAVKEFSKNN